MLPKRNEKFVSFILIVPFHKLWCATEVTKKQTNKNKEIVMQYVHVCMKQHYFSCFLFVVSCRKEREANVRLGRPRSSKLLASTENANNNEDDKDHESQFQSHSTELSHPVRELCKTVNAFIYVVDSSADSDRGTIIIFFSLIFSWKKVFKLLLD